MSETENRRRFVAHKDDQLGMIALNLLLQEHQLIWPISGAAPAPNNSVILFSTTGKMRDGCIIRVIDLSKAKWVKRNANERGIVVPEWGRYAAHAIALPSHIREKAVEGVFPEGFLLALTNAHQQLKLTPAKPKKKREKPREEWTSGYHATLRRERERERSQQGWHQEELAD